MLPKSTEDISYANAFWYVNHQRLPSGYRIFFGAAKEVVRCYDGYLISYPIPGKYNSEWKPVVSHLPKNVLDEFDWGRHIERMLRQDEIYKTPDVFLCGRHELSGQGIVIPLESVYWVHCTKHPNWGTHGRVQVSKVSQSCVEVIQELITKRLDEFHQKFPSVDSRSINNSEALPQQELSIYRPDLSPSSSLTTSMTPPVTHQDSPEQSSTRPNIPTSLLSPEQESAHNEKRQPWLKRVIAGIHWLREKL